MPSCRGTPMEKQIPTSRLSKRTVAILGAFAAILAVTAFILSMFLMPQQNEGTINPDATVTLPNYYMNGMVFQRDKPISIKGMSNAGTQLTISIDDGQHSSSATTIVADDGTFTVHLEKLPAQLEAYTLSINSGDTKLLTIDEVYIGDVFLAAGQSNMEVNFHDYYSTMDKVRGNINGSFKLHDLPDYIDDTNIHFIITDNIDDVEESFGIPLRSYCQTHWLEAEESNAEYLGYLPQSFAATLRSIHPKVPIGIIQTAWGGSSITEHTAGGHIYKTHIKPLQGYTIGGIIWYQGEKDAMTESSVANYTTNFLKLIQQYRSIFDDSELPFMYVQLARYNGNPYTFEIQVSQSQVLKVLGLKNNVAMTVALDSDKGTSDVIHPLGKDILGSRLAQQWEAIRQHDIVPSSPIADRAVQQSDGSIVITFEQGTADDLCTMYPIYSTSASPTSYALPSTNEPTGFEVMNSKGVYTYAEATISNNTVVVYPENTDVVSIRYAWPSSDISNLIYNKAKLPASPFILTVEQ